MNWLAHIFLSTNNIQFQLGNLLADKCKGKPWKGSSITVQHGFAMHKRIDSFTDSHQIVALSKSRLGEKGYLKAVVIDMVYDYLLINNWQHFSKVKLEDFIENFNQKALNEINNYPYEVRKIISKVITSKMLSSYGSLSGLKLAFQRIDQRLSPKLLSRECTLDYLPKVERELENLQNDFMEFFPELILLFSEKTGNSHNSVWIKNDRR